METCTFRTRLAVVLLGTGFFSACAAARDTPDVAFNAYDTNKDGYLSLDEFEAKGKDELAFKAADINGDKRVDREEFDKYRAVKAADQPASDTGGKGQPGY